MPTALPAALDPILTYLSELLPPPLYSFVLTILSHSLALFAALVSLSTTLLTSKPWEWDAQKLLPPLITFLTAWLAVVSLWRTTSWMIKTSVWALKWGVIIGALVALAGWATGTGQESLTNSLGGFVSDMINGQGRDATGGSRTRTSRTRPQGTRPRAWDSFRAHQDWQYHEENGRSGSNEEVQKIVEDILSRVTQGWWSTFSGSLGGGGGESSGKRQQPARREKTKKGGTSNIR